MKNKLLTLNDFKEMLFTGATLLIGGFLGDGTPERLIDAILETDKTEFTVIANDTAFPDKGIGKLITQKRVKKAIVSHIGTNPETQKQMISGILAVELVPQGTLAERVRAGGYGLGGILTPTGLGTVVEENKTILRIDERDYIVESAIKADFALINAKKADFYGNLVFSFTGRNFNTFMAFAGSHTIAEVEELVPIGGISPEDVVVPHAVVDFLVRRYAS
jgi:acetate CoA/acetoacetate CoA-transferase alpha subunit